MGMALAVPFFVAGRELFWPAGSMHRKATAHDGTAILTALPRFFQRALPGSLVFIWRYAHQPGGDDGIAVLVGVPDATAGLQPRASGLGHELFWGWLGARVLFRRPADRPYRFLRDAVLVPSIGFQIADRLGFSTLWVLLLLLAVAGAVGFWRIRGNTGDA